MNTYQWISSILGIAGFLFGGYNFYDARFKPVRESQQVLRTKLRTTLRIIDDGQVSPAIMTLDTTMVGADLSTQFYDFAKSIRLHANDFIDPTPEQLGSFATTLDEAGEAVDKATALPTDDAIFHQGDAQQRDELKAVIVNLHRRIYVLIDGITELEKRPLPHWLAKRKFKELGERSDQRQIGRVTDDG